MHQVKCIFTIYFGIVYLCSNYHFYTNYVDKNPEGKYVKIVEHDGGKINMSKVHTVSGFKFENETDYNDALDDEKIIESLESKLDYDDDNMIYALYLKTLESNSLKTVIGRCFEKKLYDRLEKNGIDMSKVPAIYIKNKKGEEKSKRYYKNALCLWRALAILFLFVIAAMFAIVLNSDSMTYVKAKDAILDDYSKWEQELNEREQNLNIRENAIEENERITK